jgi:hypothetical protein
VTTEEDNTLNNEQEWRKTEKKDRDERTRIKWCERGKNARYADKNRG